MSTNLWNRWDLKAKALDVGEYTTYRAGMLLNRRPDGSFANW